MKVKSLILTPSCLQKVGMVVVKNKDLAINFATFKPPALPEAFYDFFFHISQKVCYV